jgi:hypothetical protein
MGVAGGLYHVVNHALFKAALFLGVGAVYFRTHSLDMYHLGGLWKKMPLTFLFTLIAAMGITGVPLLNGFVSKCLIHHAIVEAYEYRELFSLDIAEKIYIVTCGGTACSFIKLIGLVFLGKPKVEYGPEVTDAPPRMLVAMGALGAAIVTLGVFPQILLKGVFQPGLHTWGLHGDLLDHYLEHYFLSPADLMSVVIAFAIGATVFTVGMKYGLFHLKGPRYLSIDWWYRQIVHALLWFCRAVGSAYDGLRSGVAQALRGAGAEYALTVSGMTRRYRLLVATVLTGAPAARDQHFVQHAYVTLERERQDTVRLAVRRAVAEVRARDDMDEKDRAAYVQAVREIAGYIAQRLMDSRMGVLSDLVRAGELQAARVPFEAVKADLAGVRPEVMTSALDLAPRRMAGENVSREIAARVNGLLSTERFDVMLKAAVPEAVRAVGRVAEAGGAVRRVFPGRAELQTLRASGLSRFEHAAAWTAEMVRLTVDALTRERMDLITEAQLDRNTVLATRLRIQRYARDISLNVAVILGVLLVFIVALVVSG